MSQYPDLSAGPYAPQPEPQAPPGYGYGYLPAAEPEPVEPPLPQPAAPARPVSRRFPAVDGLRGIAILSVLLYHTNWFSNGLFGVDAFFVLSGFLTTLLLIREVERTGRIRLGAFYRRRFKRLMPGLVITLALIVAVAYLHSPLTEARSISDQALSALLQVANWAQIARGDAYWDHFGAISPLSAMWSLSITEQFYVVWPVVLMVAFAVFRGRVVPVAVLVVLLFAASATVAPRLWNGKNSDLLYLATHTRAVAFVAGAVAAFVVHLVERRSTRRGHKDGHREGGASTALLTVIGLASFAGVVYCSIKVSTYHEPWLYRGGLVVVALLVAVLTATLCAERGPLVKLLSYKPLMETGQISYSMYLLHLPVYWMMLIVLPDLKPYALFILGGGITWLLSMILHYTTEQYRVRTWRASRAVPLFTVSALVIGLGAYWLPTYVEDSMLSSGKPVVLTLGDSFSEDLATALARHGKAYAVVDGGISGCGVMSPTAVRPQSGDVFKTSDDCAHWQRVWRDKLREVPPEAVVVHVGWDAAQQRVDGRWLTACDPQFKARYRKQLAMAVGLVHQEAPKTKVLLMNERRTNGAITLKWGTCFNEVVGDFAATSPGHVQLIDIDAFFCPGGHCGFFTPQGKRLYPDGDGVHLTDAGMAYLTPWLEKQVTAGLQATS